MLITLELVISTGVIMELGEGVLKCTNHDKIGEYGHSSLIINSFIIMISANADFS